MLQLDSGVVQSPPSSMDGRSTCMLLGVAAFAKPCLKVRFVCVSTPAHLVRQGCALIPACKPRELSPMIHNLHLDKWDARGKIVTTLNCMQAYQHYLSVWLVLRRIVGSPGQVVASHLWQRQHGEYNGELGLNSAVQPPSFSWLFSAGTPCQRKA